MSDVLSRSGESSYFVTRRTVKRRVGFTQTRNRQHAQWCAKHDGISGQCSCHRSRTATLLRKLRLRAEKRQ